MSDSQIEPRMTIKGLALRLSAALVAIALAGMVWMVLAPVSFWSMLTPAYSGEDLSVAQAHQRAVAGDITLIDIRRPDEWKRTGIGEGANPLDMRRDDFIEALGDLVGGDLDAPVALICARGVRSARMSQKLVAAGFTRVIDVPEGMMGSRAGPGWLKSGLPTRVFAGASQ